MTVSAQARPGTSLIEMLIAVALIGIIASVATLEVRRFTPPPPGEPLTIIEDTLDSVMRSGRSVTLQLLVDGRVVLATLNPDGSIVADSALHIDRFTGQSTHAK